MKVVMTNNISAMTATAPITATSAPTAAASSSSTFGKETFAKETASVVTLPHNKYLATMPNRESIALAVQDVANEKLKTDIERAKSIKQVEDLLKGILLENLELQENLNKKNIEVVQLQEKEKAEEAKLLAIIAESEANIKLWEAQQKAFVDVNAGNKQTIQLYSTMNAALTSQTNDCCAAKSHPSGLASHLMYCPTHNVHQSFDTGLYRDNPYISEIRSDSGR
jgi:hypothetical protein